MPRPIQRALSPQTKATINAAMSDAQRQAYARGDHAGWMRGFRTGLMLSGLSVLSAAFVAVVLHWVTS